MGATIATLREQLDAINSASAHEHRRNVDLISRTVAADVADLHTIAETLHASAQ